MTYGVFGLTVWLTVASPVSSQTPRGLLPIAFSNSAEFGWLRKKVEASRPLDDMTQPDAWKFSGTGRLSFPEEPQLGDMRVLRVDMQMFVDKPAPTRNGLSSVNLQRAFDGEDWRGLRADCVDCGEWRDHTPCHRAW